MLPADINQDTKTELALLSGPTLGVFLNGGGKTIAPPRAEAVPIADPQLRQQQAHEVES